MPPPFFFSDRTAKEAQDDFEPPAPLPPTEPTGETTYSPENSDLPSTSYPMEEEDPIQTTLVWKVKGKNLLLSLHTTVSNPCESHLLVEAQHAVTTYIHDHFIPDYLLCSCQAELKPQEGSTTYQTFSAVLTLACKKDSPDKEVIKRKIGKLEYSLQTSPFPYHNLVPSLTSRPLYSPQIQSLLPWVSRSRKLGPGKQERLTALQALSLHTSARFQTFRSLPYLKRIALTLAYLHQEERYRSSSTATGIGRTTVEIKVRVIRGSLLLPFGKRDLISVGVSLEGLQAYECFEERHLISAITSLLPDISTADGSFFFYPSFEHKRVLFIEINAWDIPDIKEAIFILRSKLPQVIGRTIERVSPSLVCSGNDEEIYRQMKILASQLQKKNDLPQVMIRFNSQNESMLRFQVILARVISQESPSLHSYILKLPSAFHASVEQVSPFGMVRKRFLKEVSVMTIDCSASPFIRSDHAIDLNQARRAVSEALYDSFGEFRDVNGGLLELQQQQLNQVKHLIQENPLERGDIADVLLGSLVPASSLGYLDLTCLYNLVKMTSDGLTHPKLTASGYCCTVHADPGCLILLIQATTSSFRSPVDKAVAELGLDPTTLTRASCYIEGYHFQAYLCHAENEAVRDELQEVVEEELAQWEQQIRQVVRLNLPLTASFLDPRLAANRISGQVINMLYEGLTRLDTKGVPQLAAAESVTVSDDRLTYAFTLRPTYWSDGAPVQAHDFEYAWKKALDPNFQPFYVYLFYPIQGAEAASKGELPLDQVGVEVIDDHHLTIHLAHPCSFFLELLALWIYSPLPKAHDHQQPGWSYYGGEQYVCNGPFKPIVWLQDKILELTKNKGYWDAPSVHLNRIKISIFDNLERSFNDFQAGASDWLGDPIWDIKRESLPQLRKEKKLCHRPLIAFFGLYFNTSQGPLAHPKIRQALSYAIDREQIVDRFLEEGELPAERLFSPLLSPPPSQSPITYNPKKAQQLLSEGLKELNLDTFPLLVMTHSTYEEHIILTQAVGEQWEALLGIPIQYDPQSWHQLIRSLKGKKTMVASGTSISWLKTPYYLLYRFMSDDPRVNYTGWNDEKFKDLIIQSHWITDPEKQWKVLCQAEKLLMQAMPFTPIYHYSARYAKRSQLHNVSISETGQIDFKSAYLK